MESATNVESVVSKKHDSHVSDASVEKSILKVGSRLEKHGSHASDAVVEKSILKVSSQIETKGASNIRMSPDVTLIESEQDRPYKLTLQLSKKKSSRTDQLHKRVSIVESIQQGKDSRRFVTKSISQLTGDKEEIERKLSKFALDPNVKTSKIEAGIKSGSKLDLLTRKSTAKSTIKTSKSNVHISRSRISGTESTRISGMAFEYDQSISQRTESDEEYDDEEEYDEYEIYKYEGERDIYYRRHGYGSMMYPNEDFYVGMWSKGTRQGKGSYTYTDGSTYIGDWVSGLRSGEGIMKYNDGSSYDGEWFNDQRHGWGKYEFKNGDIFEGQFVNGEMHGWKGLYSFATPQHLFYLGPFRNNDISITDCAQIGTGKLQGYPGNRITSERLMYFDRNRPYSAEKAIDEFKCPSSDEDDASPKEEIVTDWSDI